MGAMRRWLQLALPCVILLVLYFVVPAEPEIPTQDFILRGAVTLLVLGLLALLVTRQLRLQLDQGMERRVDGLVLSVITVVVTFAMCFYLLNQRNPEQVVGLHTRVDALYFTVSTLTTIGYGDLHASGQAARVLVLIQIVFNVVFVATSIRLLSLRVRTRVEQRSAARRLQGPDQE